jgi:hypothetical protein
MKGLILLSVLVISSSVFAADKCENVPECIELNSKLTGAKYLYPKDLISKKNELNKEVEMTKENADSLLSEVLFQFDYLRLPTQVEGTWKVIVARDVRYAELPVYKGSKGNIPELPKTVDYVSFMYQGVKGGDVGSIARNLRPFLSRYGRVIDTKGQILTFNDSLGNIRNILKFLEAEDRVLTKEELVNNKKLFELEHKKAMGNPPIHHKVEERKTKERQP